MILQKCPLVTPLYSLRPFKSVPATPEIKSRLLAVAAQALSELGHSRCSENNVELLQPHISQFSCCSSFTSCTMGTSAPGIPGRPHSGLWALAFPLPGCPPCGCSGSNSFTYNSGANCKVLATIWLLLTPGGIERKNF